MENLSNIKETQNKQAQFNTIENMEAFKAIITEKSLLIRHSVRERCKGAINFDYDTVVRTELWYQYREEVKAECCFLDDSTK